MAWRRRIATAVATMTLIPIALGTSALVGQAAARQPSARVVTPATARAPIAQPGDNLLVNPGAEAGASTRNGWAAVTIPGWRVRRGLPTVVKYGNPGFPAPRAPGPRTRGVQMFVGGAGGTAVLTQRIALRSPSGAVLSAGTRFALRAWLGGSATSHAVVQVQFRSAADRTLAVMRTPSLRRSGHKPPPGLHREDISGRIPASAVTAVVAVRLDTSLTNADGPDAPLVGYNHALVDNVGFSIDAKVRAPARLTPPVAHVPRFDHVFVYYFENQDYRAIIGNKKQAPYFNSLLPKSSLLADMYAEEHPSDGNYLALLGGSTFGIPLTDPLEENPRYTIDARNLGDELSAAHDSWKDYAQGANGPCDDTVHGAYWNDDPEFMYFRDVRDRPKYCARHLVPLDELHSDLKSAATTPSFGFVMPNDCTDMEGCGIKPGDRFLANTLGEILGSPAWTTQRSLVIITFDEDAYDHEHPAQRIPTIVLGSEGVRRGYTSRTRYTHYSLLRTIEAALGLGTLTKNDRYAQPLNDVFRAAS
jgi:hypothetical protein